MRVFCLLAMVAMLGGCLGMPENVRPVQGFEVERYMGKWYEIARLDHSFERGMTKVTAEYSLLDDGSVSVINRGFVAESGEWEEATGRAMFVESPETGYLKVSFFGPFYGSYVVFGLDKENYQYAFVSGPELSYLWLLCREPEPEPEVLERFIEAADKAGFDTSALIFVDQ